MPLFTDNNTPRLINVDDTGSLSRASCSGWTAADIESLGLKEVGMDRIIAGTKEARLAGVKESSLYDLILSRHVPNLEKKSAPQGSIIQPFSLVPRRNIVNANYFQIEAGAVSPSNSKYWVVTVNVGSSQWVAAPSNSLKNLEKYFLPGSYVLVEYKDGSDVARSLNMKVISAVNATSGSTEKANVTLEPNKTDAGWAVLVTAGTHTTFQPTAGQVSLLHCSVSDYESYGHQFPGYNNLGIIEYWQQTMRWVHSYNEEYVAMLNAPHTSEWFKKFRSLPLAMLRKQQEAFNQMQELNTVFYGDVQSEKQTQALWQQLDRVVDPADQDYLIEYKSSTIGIMPQLGSRVSDKQNQPLDLDSIFEGAYTLKRNRENSGGSIESIDVMTDRGTSNRIRDLMLGKYYKTKFGTVSTTHFLPDQKITFNGQTVFEYNRYYLPDQGVNLDVYQDRYFDDKLSSFSTAQKSRGRALWMIDWGDICINLIRSATAKRTTNVADELYRFVINPNIKQTMLMSKTIEVRVGDINRHTVINNFSDATPALTVGGVDLS